MGKTRIQLAEISKSYYSKAAVTQALHKISLTFSEGEFVVITGESGSGKSTLLRILGGLDTYDDGELYIDGEPTFRYDEADWEDYRRNKVGFVFQDYSLIGHYSVLDNVAGALAIMNVDMETAYEKARIYLREVGLENLEQQRAVELSSGQKQRLSIARALAKETGIILADEPTGNLDSENAGQIVKLLKEISRTRLVIMVTHNYELVEAYTTRRICLCDGEVVSDTDFGMTPTGFAAESNAVAGSAVTSNMVSDSQIKPDIVNFDKEKISKDDFPVNKRTSIDNSEITYAQSSNKCIVHRQTQQRVLRHKMQALACKYNYGAAEYRVAAHFARLNRRTKKGTSILFLLFFLVVSTMSFMFIGELYAYAEDTLTKKYDSSAYANENNTRLAVWYSDEREMTDEDIEAIKALPYVVTVDSCEYCNDINYYYELGEDYKIRYASSTDPDPTKDSWVYRYVNNDHFMRSVSCIEESDLAAGRMPEGLTEIALYSDDESLLGTTVTIHFKANNLWDSNAHCSYEMTVVGLLKKDADQIYFSEEFCMMLGSTMDSVYALQLYWDFVKTTGSKAYYQTLIPIVKEDLEGMQARVGGYAMNSQENAKEEKFGLADGRYLTLDAHRELIYTNPIDLLLEVSGNLADNSTDFLEISSELFYTYYTPVKTQAAVYITNYARTDDVIERLTQMGYEAISTWRISATEYDEEKVMSRMVVIGICVAGLLILAFTSILTLSSLMNLRRKDFAVLKHMGMQTATLRRISYFEIGVHTAAAIVIAVIIMSILRNIQIEVFDFDNMMWYMRWHSYVLLILYNLLIYVLSVAAFNRSLEKWMKKL